MKNPAGILFMHPDWYGALMPARTRCEMQWGCKTIEQTLLQGLRYPRGETNANGARDKASANNGCFASAMCRVQNTPVMI